MTHISSFVDESPTRKVLTLEVPAEEVREVTERTVKSVARQVRLPGFRPGKVPPELVRKRFAEEIRGETLEHLVQHAVGDALREKGLVPLGTPKVDDVKFEEGAPLTFKVELEIRPKVEPKDYRGLKVPSDPVEPKQEDLDGVVGRIRESHATYEPIEGRPASEGDFALVDIQGSFPGGDGKDFSEDKVLVEVGGERTMPELTAHLRNAEVGLRATFQKDFPADFPDGDFAGKTVLYNLSFHGLKKRVLPELDDELARLALTPREGEPPEGASVAMLMEKIREGVVREKEEALQQKRRRAALDGLLALNEVDAPESMVESEVDSSLREYARFLTRQGVDLKSAGLDWARLREEAHPAAVKRVKEYLILDAVADAEAIEVSETELDAELKTRSRMMGMAPSELKASLNKAERLDGVREELRIDKVIRFLLDQAVVAPSA
jgi:trigger factor